MKYSKNIIIYGVAIGYFEKKLQILSRNKILENSVKKSLKELFADEVSGNVSWKPLDIIESSGNLYLIFLGLVDYESIDSDYIFKSLDNKLTRIERLAAKELKEEIKKLNPTHIRSILGSEFLIRDLFGLYKGLVNKNKDRANFYKLIKEKDYIVPVGRRKRDVYHRPPEYYKIKI